MPVVSQLTHIEELAPGGGDVSTEVPGISGHQEPEGGLILDDISSGASEVQTIPRCQDDVRYILLHFQTNTILLDDVGKKRPLGLYNIIVILYEQET